MGRVEVSPYSIDNLVNWIAKLANVDKSEIELKSHRDYFESYLKEMEVSTLVVEPSYVDKDFLEDFSAFYVRCFKEYPRFCGRIHFFSLPFEESNLRRLIEEGSDEKVTREELQRNYRGFTVIKPLPQTCLGRTCLATYPEDNGRRRYSVNRSYETHLVGITLSVESVAFQEQDTVAAACATSALWSAFQVTGNLYGHEIPSPVKITQWANENFPMARRTLPSTGLTIEQMAGPIRRLGLEPDVASLLGGPGSPPAFLLKSTAYGYLMAKIPVILVGTLYNCGTLMPYWEMGRHAITITGVSLGERTCRPLDLGNGLPGTLLRATKIDKFYVHDDQVGPFARITLETSPSQVIYGPNLDTLTYYLWETSWKGPFRRTGFVKFLPEQILLPLYPKIRIPFHRMEERLLQLDLYLEALHQEAQLPYQGRFEWDLSLTRVSDYKEFLFDKFRPATKQYRSQILTETFPRFMWRMAAYLEDVQRFEFLFDATDLDRGKPFIRTVIYDQVLCQKILQSVVDRKQRLQQYCPKWVLDILESFTESNSI